MRLMCRLTGMVICCEFWVADLVIWLALVWWVVMVGSGLVVVWVLARVCRFSSLVGEVVCRFTGVCWCLVGCVV